MTDEKIEVFRERLQPRLRDYLKAAHVELSEDEITTVCPICGDLAGLMKDDTWLCMHCDRRGDLLDYVLCEHPRMTPVEAVRHIQRTLGERITELDAVNANELMDMEFQPTGWLIEKLLGKGVYLLAGASKIGKSWLVLWLADRVSKGEKVWDFKTAQCDVLYVSLEDTAQRIQRRLSEVTGGEADRVWIATEAELLGSAHLDQKAHQRGQHHSDEDAHGLKQHAHAALEPEVLIGRESHRQHQCHQQDLDQRVIKFGQELLPQRFPLGRGEHIDAIPLTAGNHLLYG